MWYLAVVELLNDSFTLLADVTDTDELRLPVALEKTAANSLNHSAGRASTRHAAVLNVPEDSDRGDVLYTGALW